MDPRYPSKTAMSGGDNELLQQMVGLGVESELIDYSGGDVTPTMQDCRAITCTGGTTIKIDFETDNLDSTTTTTQTVVLPAEPRIIPMRYVSKIYKTGTDATNLYLWK